MAERRILYFDYLRILAVFNVILLHVTATHLWDDIGTSQFLVYDTYSTISRWCVPVFVMISGALFLDPQREICIKKLYTKNLLRLVTAFCFWSILYAALDFAYGVRTRDVLYNLVQGHYHLWFIFMLAGLYLVVPILRKVTESKKLSQYFLVLWFLFVIVLQTVIYLAGFVSSSFSELFSKVSDSLSFCVAGGYSGYFVLGYYLNHYGLTKKKRTFVYILGIAGFIATFLLPILYFKVRGFPNYHFNENLTVNVFLESVFVFVFFKYLIKTENGKDNKIVKTLSDCSFGIYLVHLVIYEFFKNQFGIDSLIFNPIVSIPLISIGIFIISFIITYVLKKIPILQKYIV